MKYIFFLLLILSPKLHAFKLEGVSFRANTDFLMNYNKYQQRDNQWLNDVNHGNSIAIGLEFSINEVHFLIEQEGVHLKEYEPIQGAGALPNAPPDPYHETKGIIISDSFNRINLLYKYNYHNISISAGPALLIADIETKSDTHFYTHFCIAPTFVSSRKMKNLSTNLTNS
ncbi:hypothetical protein [Marinicellulosiphila megalodicopiae]|uniref:hypothetical protein n=1 Tax=Marinicellulosiphila megalodicopiae TaxID=2724896 RepID=UPI003BAE58C6